jgi:hypothetical protein
MMSVTNQPIIMSVTMLNVIMLSVMAPCKLIEFIQIIMSNIVPI